VSYQLRTETITTAAKLQGLMPEWQNLFRRRADTPFVDPRLIMAWWQARGSKQGHRLHIVIGRVAGRLVAVAPLSVVRRSAARFLRWAGDEDFDYCDTLLEDAVFGVPLWQAVRRSGGFDVALIKNIRPNTHTCSVLARFGRAVRSNDVFRIKNQWASRDEWARAVLPTTWLKRARYIDRKLEPHGQQELEIIIQPDDPRLAECICTLARQKSEWTARRAKSDGISFEDRDSAATLRHVAHSAGESGILHLSRLRCGSNVLAVHLGFVHNGTFYYYMPSYDLAWSAFSPGKILMTQLIGWAVEKRLRYFDFMSGDDAYKAEFASERLTLTDFTFAGSLPGYVMEAALERWYFRTRETSSNLPRC
jgi:CelD/BcsL family acetyltransferase involved in cellulose biosynthesis